jgi:hypothetical protein
VNLNDAVVVCSLCLVEEESTSHFFFTSHYSWKVWIEVHRWFSLSTVLPKEEKVHFLQHLQMCVSLRNRRGAWSIWVVVLWCVCNTRNSVSF